MSQSGLQAFDGTTHTTNVWLHEVEDETGWADRRHA